MNHISAALSETDLAFIERFGAYGTRAGMPLSVARVFAYLLVCEPPAQTAKSIAASLGLSAGSVSIATTMLTQLGLVSRVTLTQTKGVHYVVEPDNFLKVIEQRVQAHAEAEAIAAEALKHSGSNPRLIAMRDVYGKAAKELEGLLRTLQQ
jgi:DNA-binding transcriptional regulator GbsR (MarR family)